MNRRFSADDLLRMDAASRIPRPIDLAHTAPFEIGAVKVRPATREVAGEQRSEVLEPLVMQVLVALHSARGATLSRDDLIDICWGGRAVTDDALNRVITRLRALARDFRAFRIDTITKVGYRLVSGDEDKTAAIVPRGAAPIDRRTIVAGGVAVAAAGAGILAWRQPWRHRPSPDAVRLFELGNTAQRQGVTNQIRQAISYYEQAVRTDPLFSQGWGALALAQTHILQGFGEPGTEGTPTRLVSAARRALQLDPDNVDAQLALILLKPFFHNWAVTEEELRRLAARYPGHWLARGRLAVLLYDVGRLGEGIEIHDELDKIDSMLPVRDAFWANGLLCAGRLDEASAILDHAHDVWPAHPTLWSMRYRFLLFSGRPRAAAAFALDPDSRPSGLDRREIEIRVRLAKAAESHAENDVRASIRDFQQLASADATTIPSAAAVFALLGRADLAFASLDRYYFNAGAFGHSVPISRMTRRSTIDLFSPPLAKLHGDPRFASILQRTGLEAYWGATKTVPDYRRAA
jgi:DNA-binding winged helix-turn-helix (wHTH) protein/tetratricopeptide (TPR) repeat protein